MPFPQIVLHDLAARSFLENLEFEAVTILVLDRTAYVLVPARAPVEIAFYTVRAEYVSALGLSVLLADNLRQKLVCGAVVVD